MPFPVLEEYLSRLRLAEPAHTHLWADADGRAQGRYFHATLTSAFQPIRIVGSGGIVGYEGLARSYSDNDQGLCVWRLLDHAASDEESVALDRLCRMLHAINFFRQPEAGGHDLYLHVHARLLAAVEDNHGAAFGRVLEALALARGNIVLQLPPAAAQQPWLLDYVADNYRSNGFRIAVNARDAEEALKLAERVRPAAVKIDARHIAHEEPLLHLLAVSEAIGARVIFKRVENARTAAALAGIVAQSGKEAYAQGFVWDLPTAMLETGMRPDMHAQMPAAPQQAGAA